MDQGGTFAELKAVFNSFPSTLTVWRKLLNQTAELKPRPIPGRPPTIDIPVLQADTAAKPDWYLRELAVPHGCPVNAVWLALERHNITYKKTMHLS
jgi:transposase